MTSSVRAGLIGVGIGGAAMFLLDPNRGARRRAVVRDTSVAIARKTRDAAGATRRDLGNRLERIRGWSPTARIACGIAAGGAGLALASLARRRGGDGGDAIDERIDDSVTVDVLAVEMLPADVLCDDSIV